jgi:multisubunit Na+/H+ antiporter MnhB subunit
VDLLNRVVDNNALTLAAARYQTRSAGLVILIVGVVFLGFAGVLSMSPGWGFNALLIGCFGATFLVLGVTRLNKKSQYPAPDK